MYKILGYRDCVMGQCLAQVSTMLGEEIGDSLIGIFTPYLPDGVILERRGQWFVTNHMDLNPINMLDPGECITTPGRYIPDFTRQDARRWIEEAQRQAKDLAKYSKV